MLPYKFGISDPYQEDKYESKTKENFHWDVKIIPLI